MWAPIFILLSKFVRSGSAVSHRIQVLHDHIVLTRACCWNDQGVWLLLVVELCLQAIVSHACVRTPEMLYIEFLPRDTEVQSGKKVKDLITALGLEDNEEL